MTEPETVTSITGFTQEEMKHFVGIIWRNLSTVTTSISVM